MTRSERRFLFAALLCVTVVLCIFCTAAHAGHSCQPACSVCMFATRGEELLLCLILASAQPALCAVGQRPRSVVPASRRFAPELTPVRRKDVLLD